MEAPILDLARPISYPSTAESIAALAAELAPLAGRIREPGGEEALRPDAEKLAAYAAALLAVESPIVVEPEAAAVLDRAQATIIAAVAILRSVGGAQ